MDALAHGYGSDSSSDGSAENKTQTLGLLANYSDNSSSDEDADRPLVIGTAAIIETKKTTSMHQGNDSFSSIENGSKKRKLLISETQTEKDQHGLPSPPLLSSSASSSQDNLMLFSKNYLTNKLQYKTINTDHQLQVKLEQMHQHQSTGTNKSFAEQLKLQKDFGNPHMFPSVIEHFGIDPLESNSSILKVKFQGFEFIDRLMVKEEENRIREAQNT